MKKLLAMFLVLQTSCIGLVVADVDGSEQGILPGECIYDWSVDDTNKESTSCDCACECEDDSDDCCECDESFREVDPVIQDMADKIVGTFKNPLFWTNLKKLSLKYKTMSDEFYTNLLRRCNFTKEQLELLENSIAVGSDFFAEISKVIQLKKELRQEVEKQVMEKSNIENKELDVDVENEDEYEESNPCNACKYGDAYTIEKELVENDPRFELIKKWKKKSENMDDLFDDLEDVFNNAWKKQAEDVEEAFGAYLMKQPDCTAFYKDMLTMLKEVTHRHMKKLR